MKKKIIYLSLVLMLVFAFASPVFASSLVNPDLPRVVDYGDMFTDSEEKILEEELYKLINKYNYDFFIMTSNDHGTAADDEEYIEAIWDANGFGTGDRYSGWAIFVCLECRSWMHDACGDAVDYLTYDTVNIIDDFMEPYMQSGDYYDAMMAGISELDSLFSMGAESYAENTYSPSVDPDPYNPDPYTPEPEHESTFFEKLRTGGISGVIAGLLAGFVSLGSAKKSMKTVSRAYSAENYVKPGSFRLQRADNILMNVFTQRIAKEQPRQNSGGPHHSGGSSFSGPHISSGGNMHSSGGGRHF